MGRFVRRLGFPAAVGLPAVANVLSIPVIISHVGAAAWSVLAVGQAIGTLAAVLGSFGWGVSGPAEIARSHPGARADIYRDSISARLWLLPPAIVAACVVSYLVPANYKLVACLAALAALSTCMGAAWFFIGAASPWHFLSLDALPRTIGTLLGLLAISSGAGFVWFPVLQLLGSLCSFVSATLYITGRRVIRDLSFSYNLRVLREYGDGVLISGTSALYLSTPLIILTAIAPGAAPTYALAEKLMRYLITALSPITQIWQGWVPRPSLVQTASRANRAVVISSAEAVVAGCAFAACAPWLGGQLSHATLTIPWPMSSFLGICLAAVVLSQCAGIACLMGLKMSRSVAVSTGLGAVIGLPSVVLGAFIAGANGVAGALAVSEMTVTVYQLVVLRRAIRSHLTPAARPHAESAATPNTYSGA